MGEMRQNLNDFQKGMDVKMEKFRFLMGTEDAHYPGEMISGCKLLEKCIDCATSLSIKRDKGDGSLFVHTEGDILRPVHICDVVEVIAWSIKDGKRSREYGFEMYKLSEYDPKTDLSEQFDIPPLTVKGKVVMVVNNPA